MLLVQIDDRSGEVLGRALEDLMELGARNVQLLSSTTKKGRPGQVLLVDLEPDREPQIAVYVATELGAWGYQVLETRHRHFDIAERERRAVVSCGPRTREFSLAFKSVSVDGRVVRVKAERCDVEQVQRFARAAGDSCSTDTVRSRLEHEALHQPGADPLVIRLW